MLDRQVILYCVVKFTKAFSGFMKFIVKVKPDVPPFIGRFLKGVITFSRFDQRFPVLRVKYGKAFGFGFENHSQ